MTTMTAPPTMDLAALGAAIDAAMAEPEPPPEPVEPHPTMMEAITAAVEEVLTGNHKATVEKRKALIATLAVKLVNVPIYGIEIDGARLPIGEPIELDNASIEVDGYGCAVSVWAKGTPLWDAE